MADRDPRQAVAEHLTQPAGWQLPAHGTEQSRRPSTRPVASLGQGNPFTAIADSIEFLKERGTDDRRLFAVLFDDGAQNHWFWLVAAQLDEGFWTAHSVAGGTDGPVVRRTTRSRPWLNLCGQWGPDRLYAGGQLHAGGAPVGKVRLTLADGTELADDGEADVALFVGRHGAEPVTVDIFDVNGSLLSSQKAF